MLDHTSRPGRLACVEMLSSALESVAQVACDSCSTAEPTTPRACSASRFNQRRSPSSASSRWLRRSVFRADRSGVASVPAVGKRRCQYSSRTADRSGRREQFSGAPDTGHVSETFEAAVERRRRPSRALPARSCLGAVGTIPIRAGDRAPPRLRPGRTAGLPSNPLWRGLRGLRPAKCCPSLPH